MGPVPLSHTELLAWQINMQRRLHPWEISIIRRLSMEWIAESQRAEVEGCPEPFVGGDIAPEERIAVADSLRDSFRAMAGG